MAIKENIKMKISDKGLNLIKEFEGFSKTPYLCPAGVPTIGYGTTRYNDGKAVSLADRPITEEEALELLRYQVDNIHSKAVSNAIKHELTQSQFDALISFTYNLGESNLKRSTLLRKLNAWDILGAANEFVKWNKAGGKVLSGLTRRRRAEKALFLS